MRFASLLRLVALATVATVLISARCDDPRPGGEVDRRVVVKGRLTDEGVECPTLRDRNNVLYSLVGSIDDYKRGDRVCVKGRLVDASICMKGTTIVVDWIGLSRWCP